VAPVALVWLRTIAGYQDTVGQPAQITIASMATTAGAQPGSDIPRGSDIALPRPSAEPQSQHYAEPTGNLEVCEAELLQEALRLFGYSLDTLGVSQEGRGSVPMPGDPGGTGGERGAMAPAPPDLPVSIPGNQDVEGQPAGNVSSMATPAGASPGSDVPPSPTPALYNQDLGDRADDLEVSKEELTGEALRLFAYTSDTLGVSQESASSVPVPGDPWGNGAAVPPCNFALLSMPEEVLPSLLQRPQGGQYHPGLQGVHHGAGAPGALGGHRGGSASIPACWGRAAGEEAGDQPLDRAPQQAPGSVRQHKGAGDGLTHGRDEREVS